ncbi:hypothetical protein DRO35_03900 [Candidatus Bathyarchaeota archaeon]|nr:MAG: hypothetical protein DRO35_03900 [Candidatus Bathyarchaeota archaeon]
MLKIEKILRVKKMRVLVHRVESIRDASGNLGKRIELVEESVVPSFAIRPQSEEARMVQEMVRVLQQQMPILGARMQPYQPKMILFLTEEECEQLGVEFDVNQIYEVTLSGQAIKFRKIS